MRKTLPLLGQMFAKVESFTDSATNSHHTNERLTTKLAEANVITSMVAGDVRKHKVVLDLDFPATLLDSSTPGNHHLFIDHEITWDQYEKLLDVLAEVGLIEPGFVDASKKRMYSAVRLPWIKKTPAEAEKSRQLRRQRAIEARRLAETSPF